MSIRCLLCNEEFGQITWKHLRSAHSITLDDYREMFPGAELMCEEMRHQISESVSETMTAYYATHEVSEETRRKLSEALIGREVSEETCQRLSESLTGRVTSEETKRLLSKRFTGRDFSDEWCQRISEAKMGHTTSEKTRQKISETMKKRWEEPEYAKQQSETHKKQWEDPEYSRRVSESNSAAMLERWKDPEYIQHWSEGMRQALRRKPNEAETQLLSVLERHFPDEWKYVGDDQVRLGRYNPDFINVNGRKQVIEVFGYHWHDPEYFPNRLNEEELIAYYKTFGFDCLVFWEYDVYNEEEVVERVSKFVERLKSERI